MTIRATGLLLAAAALTPPAVAAMADESLVEKGEYLVHAGGCITCHTADEDDAVPLAGGRALESPYGTFYSPNITPDTETGIGKWSEEAFVNAFWNGVSPEGQAYFPAFPYTSYTGVTREDLLAIKAYLFSLEPVRQVNHEHDLSFLASRFGAGVWKRRYFKPARFEADPEESGKWNRGAYLVRHLGHCGECHTPRGRFGVLQKQRALSGNPEGPEGETVPNITADPDNGIGRWSMSDIEFFLEVGMLPDGDFAGSVMAEVIENCTSYLTAEDRRAIATYLKESGGER